MLAKAGHFASLFDSLLPGPSAHGGRATNRRSFYARLFTVLIFSFFLFFDLSLGFCTSSYGHWVHRLRCILINLHLLPTIYRYFVYFSSSCPFFLAFLVINSYCIILLSLRYPCYIFISRLLLDQILWLVPLIFLCTMLALFFLSFHSFPLIFYPITHGPLSSLPT